MKRALVVMVLILCVTDTGRAVQAGATQTPARDAGSRITATGDAGLGGVVVADGESPARPIRRAIVTITGTGIATSVQVVTDDVGRFSFSGLPAGRFSLTAEKPAYLKTYYGSARTIRPPGMPIALAAGQQLTSLTVPLVRGAAISGRVTDQGGGPVAGAQVQIQMYSTVGADRRLVTPPIGLTIATADDRGAYRVYGLAAGEYLVRALGGGGFGGGAGVRLANSDAPVTRLPSYHPGVADATHAQPVTVAAGEDRQDVNIISQFGRVVRVDGTAVGPNGEPVQMSVGIADLATGTIGTSMGGVPAAEGRFFLTSVTPGRWLLFGRGAPLGTKSDSLYPWWGQLEITTATENITGLVMTFAPGSVVTGRLVFQGTQPQPDLSKVRVSLTHLPTIAGTGVFMPAATPKPDGSFVFTAVPPGKYRVGISALGAWALKSAANNGRDTLDTPLEIAPGDAPALVVTLTDQPTEITGVLRDQLDRPAPEYSVVVFSADRSHWTSSPRRSSGLVRLASDGSYRITGLPAGNYLLTVVTDIEPGLLSDSPFLEQLARSAVPVTLAEGEKKRQDFRIK